MEEKWKKQLQFRNTMWVGKVEKKRERERKAEEKKETIRRAN